MNKFLAFITPIILLLISGNVIISCKDTQSDTPLKNVPRKRIEKGRRLAAKYCQSCHALPDPSLLDSKTWEDGVLPVMGPYLGIFSYRYKRYPSGKKDRFLPSAYYPSEPLVTNEEWQSIMDYYIALSPDSLIQSKSIIVKPELNLFNVETPLIKILNPAVSLVKFYNNKIIIGDYESQNIFQFTNKLDLQDSFSFEGTLVDIIQQDGDAIICNTGYLDPNNGKFGKLQYLDINNKRERNRPVSLADSLQRPVQFIEADIDNDGKQDWVICEFGFNVGSLSWLKNLGNNQFQKQIIKPIAGAIRVIADDYNSDGATDLWVLFAQGNEGVFLFTNDGSGKFKEQQVLKFAPVYGSTYFELLDFNKDGFKDIVYTCGDNADYSRILKPYHGVYLFMNDGKNNFKQAFFFAINGCYKAIPADFDNDGDLDIATISFFADYANKPEEGFIYLENLGNNQFKDLYLKDSQKGRWLTMDSGDFDADGKLDLILGNFTYGPTTIRSKMNWKAGPPFLLLKNSGKELGEKKN